MVHKRERGAAPGRATPQISSNNSAAIADTQIARLFRPGNSGLDGEVIAPVFEDPAGRFSRVRAALLSGYALAGATGSRKAQLAALDGLTAIKLLALDAASRGAP